MLSNTKADSRGLGRLFGGMMAVAVLAIGTLAVLLPVPPKAHARPVGPRPTTEQVFTFACESEAVNGLAACVREVDAEANEWLLKNSQGVEIVGRQATIAIGGAGHARFNRAYIVTVFYRKLVSDVDRPVVR